MRGRDREAGGEVRGPRIRQLEGRVVLVVARQDRLAVGQPDVEAGGARQLDVADASREVGALHHAERVARIEDGRHHAGKPREPLGVRQRIADRCQIGAEEQVAGHHRPGHAPTA